MSQEEREALKAARKTAKADFDNKIAAILTPAQNEQYQNLGRANKGQQRPNRGGARGDKGKVKGAKGNAEKVQEKRIKGAKGKPTPEERVNKRVSWYAKQLNLDIQQQTDLKEFLMNQPARPQGQDWKSLSPEERKAFQANQKTALEEGLGEILSAEQMEAYNNLPKRKGQKGKAKGKKGKKGKKKDIEQ